MCSHWSNKLTWRSFVCVVIAALIFNTLTVSFSQSLSDGLLIQQGLVLGLSSAAAYPKFQGFELPLYVAVGVVGGALGALYVQAVTTANRLRRRLTRQRPARKAAEAALLSFVAFTVLYWLPFGFSCRDCVSGMACYHGNASSAHRMLADQIPDAEWPLPALLGGFARRRLAGGGTTLQYVQWQCHHGQYNEMATLLHSGQEGLIKHLLARDTLEQYTHDPTVRDRELGRISAASRPHLAPRSRPRPDLEPTSRRPRIDPTAHPPPRCSESSSPSTSPSRPPSSASPSPPATSSRR